MTTILVIGSIFFLSGLVQGFTGFGSALIAIPLLCFVVDIKFAIPLSVLNSLVITSYLAAVLKSHLDKKKLGPLCLATIPGIVAGVTLLKHVPSHTVAQLLGLLLILYGCYNIFITPKRRNLHNNWAYLAGFCSGAIGSAFSAGGPPVIIYATLTGWDKDLIKATLTGFFLFSSLLVALAHGFTGLTTCDVFKSFMFSWPFVLAGTIAGSRCYHFLVRETYLKSIYIFLVIMGILMMTLKS